MKSFVWSLLYCGSLLLADVRATYHLNPGDHPLLAQSHAQTRHNARPPLRTLNPAIHRSDYMYRGGYHYHYQPPGIPPPIMHPPLPLYPPLTYHRQSVPMPPYHHRFKGPVSPHMHHIYKGVSPPVSHHPHHIFKSHFPHKLKGPIKGPCPQKLDPIPTPPVLQPPTIPSTVPEPTVLPTLPETTAAPLTTSMPVLVTTVETTTPVTLPVSTQSGFNTTVSPVETEVKVEVVEDPCKCEARLVFQKKTQAAIQQLTAKLNDVSGRIDRLENMVGRG